MHNCTIVQISLLPIYQTDHSVLSIQGLLTACCTSSAGCVCMGILATSQLAQVECFPALHFPMDLTIWGNEANSLRALWFWLFLLSLAFPALPLLPVPVLISPTSPLSPFSLPFLSSISPLSLPSLSPLSPLCLPSLSPISLLYLSPLSPVSLSPLPSLSPLSPT